MDGEWAAPLDGILRLLLRLCEHDREALKGGASPTSIVHNGIHALTSWFKRWRGNSIPSTGGGIIVRIYLKSFANPSENDTSGLVGLSNRYRGYPRKIGRASCRERV